METVYAIYKPSAAAGRTNPQTAPLSTYPTSQTVQSESIQDYTDFNSLYLAEQVALQEDFMDYQECNSQFRADQSALLESLKEFPETNSQVRADQAALQEALLEYTEIKKPCSSNGNYKHLKLTFNQ